MEIRLKNIGLVEESTIKLDGLTVLTGKNESGKTTAEKALYALIEAVRNLQAKAERDRDNYIRKQLSVLSDTSTLYRPLRFFFPETKGIMERYRGLVLLAVQSRFAVPSNMKAEEFARQIERELDSFRSLWDEETTLADDGLKNYLWEYQRFFRTGSRRRTKRDTIRAIQEQCERDSQLIEELLSAVNGDSDLVYYARESINQTLNAEFSGQIQPLGWQKSSSIQLSEGDNLYFDVKIVKNQVDKSKDCFFASTASPIQTAYFVDNLSAFDLSGIASKAAYMRIRSKSEEPESEERNSFFDSDRIQGHMQQLRSVLRQKQDMSPLEKTILDAKLEPVRKMMNGVVPGAFDFSGEEDYYIREDGGKLRLGNMAAGSKVFSIVKILLERGLLNESALLILDEPEVHLHPDWQNQFAELIVLLVKELHVRVFLATHSADFMLALDAFMRKHKINDITNFYQAERLENGFVRHNCVNDHMELIYRDFLESFSKAKALRDSYVFTTADDGEEET